ncbi:MULTISPECIES: hypothetical protein [Streptomyces]|uniref:hypothetical protein n=1 Tax=Streptomyces TaxID=1883 RepID=UPI0013B7A074|nr:hypothetical protein [Streptomyces rochei]NEC70973.1 hypothetical protein [Streptomyces rochei]
MLLLAVLLLPALSLLLVVMSRIEDHLLNDTSPTRHARHARPRHLRLIPGGKNNGASSPALPPQHSSNLRKDAA